MTRAENRAQLLDSLPKGATCAEIGVWDGGFSEEILERTQPKKLHLIDPWLFQPEFNNSAFGRQAHSDTMDDKYPAVCAKFKGDKRVTIHRAMSHEALEAFKDAALDWVYIDGNHNYEVVSNDLLLSLVKVRHDGIICGDDFFWGRDQGAPVRTAVREVLDLLQDEVSFQRFGQQWRLELKRAKPAVSRKSASLHKAA